MNDQQSNQSRQPTPGERLGFVRQWPGVAALIVSVHVTRVAITFCFLSLICVACQMQPAVPPAAEWRAKLKTVTLTDGISRSEAQIIGQCYFARHVGCGGFSGIRDGGDHWIVDGNFGIAGAPVRGFFIDKHSGKVTSPIGPSYDNPFEIFP